MATQKGPYAYAVQQKLTALAALLDTIDPLYKAYFDRGFNSGGSNPITDADLSAAGINMTAAQLTSAITLIAQLINFRGNVAVATADYKATLNGIRTDF